MHAPGRVPRAQSIVRDLRWLCTAGESRLSLDVLTGLEGLCREANFEAATATLAEQLQRLPRRTARRYLRSRRVMPKARDIAMMLPLPPGVVKPAAAATQPPSLTAAWR